MTPQEVGGRAADLFRQTYGHAPRWLVAAPGRVNVIGEHTDYNDGFVLPMAIERFTAIAAAPSREKRIQLRTSEPGRAPSIIDLSGPIKPHARGEWTNYVAGVLAGFAARGVKIEGFDAMIHSTVPLGGGLSSSAALEVATATLIEAITGRTIDPVEKALLCQKAEHDFAGVPCGIMDQFISALGKKDKLLLLDCRSRQTELVPMSDPRVQLLITNTNVKHELGSGEYARRRAQCEAAAKALGISSLRDASLDTLAQSKGEMDDVSFRRARHVIGEIERTTKAAQSIRASNWEKTGELMYASHNSLRDDYEVSCRELDFVVEIARGIGLAGGVFGCRMTGGGFGGCTVTLVKADAVPAVMQKIAAEYKNKTGIEAAMFTSRPAAGASILSPI